MTKYKCTTIRINGTVDINVEMWTTFNHSTIMRGETCIFDGYFPEAWSKFKEEVDRIAEIAKASGMPYEVIGALGG